MLMIRLPSFVAGFITALLAAAAVRWVDNFIGIKIAVGQVEDYVASYADDDEDYGI